MIPGTLIEPTFPLSRFRSHQASGHLSSVIQNLTKPGEIVLELNTPGPSSVSEVLENNRRILAVNINPVSMLTTHVALNPIDVTQVRAALTKLGDITKGNQTLFSHINQQYRTKCPECGHEGTAAWFAWDRDTRQPFAKCVHCPNCDMDREGHADRSDALITNLNPSTGLAYNVALERASANDEGIHSRIAELVSLYTSRNLSALLDIIHRLPRASQNPDIRRVLTTFIIEALDKGSSLVPYGNADSRPKSLKPPQLFLEYNIWDLIENAMRLYSGQHRSKVAVNLPPTSLQSLLDNDQGYSLIANTVQSVVSRLPRNHIKLLVLHPVYPDIVCYAMCSLWSTWLWKSDKLPSSFRAYMGRRRFDQDWSQRILKSILRAIKPALDNQVRILSPLPSHSLSSLEDILESVHSSGYEINHWLNAFPEGYRLLFETERNNKLRSPIPPYEHFTQTINKRGEPILLHQLQAAYMLDEPQKKLDMVPSHLTENFTKLEGTQLIWLRDDRYTLKPLSDRVEQTTLHLLQEQGSWERNQLEEEIYSRFYGGQTPEPELVNTCINAYTVASKYNGVSLRPEDAPKKRRVELSASRIKIKQLGVHLGFTVGRRLNGDIVWKEPGKITYLFRFTSTALFSSYLTNIARPNSTERRCLVLPGGRASLVALKLRRDPRLQKSIIENNWVFIKFRHLRRMLTEITHRGEIDFYLGLDPIVEMGTAQIPLPLERRPKDG